MRKVDLATHGAKRSPPDIAALRLANQLLTRPTIESAPEVVKSLGAVQAQDYAGAKWGIAQRTTGVLDSEIERAIGSGEILRTHVLRPTWHFVSATDIRWMLALTAPRIRKSAAHHDRKLGIDDDVRRRTRAVLGKALRDGKRLTRLELAGALTNAGVRADGTQRLAHLMIHAELDGLVCSGGRRGKQFTYALLDECVPVTRELHREEALYTLATRYFATRGPASEDDFAWWSGLTKSDAKTAVSSIGSLESMTIDGRKYWFTPSRPPKSASTVRLLASYDEYLVSYADRSAAQARVKPEAVGETFDFLGSYVVVSNGQIIGRWKRSVTARDVIVTLQPLTRFSRDEHNAVRREAERFAQYVELPLQIQTLPKAASRRL
ncbi:MAG TPA: winged helix DNA-binding domain-containing protein [Gemmatimonadaceae bacterium]|nr:winged helix DNA-binding domain-containing protein [Gemmatimonadaceae bacterium]